MGAIASPVASVLGGVNAVAGAALPAIGTATRLVNTVQNFSSGSSGDQLRAQQDLALRQLQATQQARENQLSADVSLRRQQLAADAASDNSDRRAALRRAVARQRAQFSASGVTSAGGSSEAVLLGLFNESESEAAQRNQIDGLRNRALDLDLSNQRSVNVLQRTQLQQRQRLERSLF